MKYHKTKDIGFWIVVDPQCYNGVHRTTTVEMICDPLAGPGQPQKPEGQDQAETSLCVYNFEWRSMYACPVCLDANFTQLLGVCQAGRQRQFYVTYDNCTGSRPDSYVACKYVFEFSKHVPCRGFVSVYFSVCLE